MTQLSPQRRFTAELRRLSSGSSIETMAPHETLDPQSLARLRDDVLRAIEDLRLSIEANAMTPSAPAASVEATASEVACAPVADPQHDPNQAVTPVTEASSEKLLDELRQLEGAISETKREIAALRKMSKPPETIATATNELDAVVEATETATDCILAASERIDEVTTRLRTSALAADDLPSIEEISEQVTHIFEACNFQDITGQRINKVVGAMKFIEERVERMIDILGGSAAFAALETHAAAEPEKPKDDESHLLCGPQLDEHKISQDDIDAFFN